MRLFVALDIPEEVRRRLADYVAELHRIPEFAEARWSNVDGLHVTLKFIGEYPEEKLAELKSGLGQVKAVRFEVGFSGIGFFPQPRAPRVMVAEMKYGDELPRLAAGVEQTCSRLGIAVEDREYHPHLTLARFKPPQRRLGPAVERLLAMPAPGFGRMSATEFFLYQSKTSPKGSVYTKLERFSLV
jgi:2'-5' RNA ligase